MFLCLARVGGGGQACGGSIQRWGYWIGQELGCSHRCGDTRLLTARRQHRPPVSVGEQKHSLASPPDSENPDCEPAGDPQENLGMGLGHLVRPGQGDPQGQVSGALSQFRVGHCVWC